MAVMKLPDLKPLMLRYLSAEAKMTVDDECSKSEFTAKRILTVYKLTTFKININHNFDEIGVTEYSTTKSMNGAVI